MLESRPMSNESASPPAYRQTVSDIRPNLKFAGRLLVRAAQVQTAKNGKPFLVLSLVDRTGGVQAKIWDWAGDPPAAGTVLDLAGTGDEYNGHLQLRVQSFKPVEDGDPADYVPAAPETPENTYAEIRATADALRDGSLRKIVGQLLDWAVAANLLAAPAAKSMHHATRGGLLHHTVMMLRAAKALAEVYRFLDKDLLYAGVIVHDLAKLDEMQTDSLGLVSDYTRDGRLVGHIVRGVVNVEKAAACTGASRERATLLQHLVLSHHGEAEFGSPVPPKCPEALVLSAIDRLDAKLFQMHDALRGTAPGAFSAPVWALDRAEIYKPELPTPPDAP